MQQKNKIDVGRSDGGILVRTAASQNASSATLSAVVQTSSVSELRSQYGLDEHLPLFT
jgi:hypothetical protein